MLICSDCGSQFEKPDTYAETHGFNSPPFEGKRCCPFCKSTNIHEKNLTHCRCCGAKLTNAGGEYCSDACRRRGEELWRRERLRRKLANANPISRIIKEAEEYNRAHGTDYTYGEYVAYILPGVGEK